MNPSSTLLHAFNNPNVTSHTNMTTDNSTPHIPLSGLVTDGWSKEDEATATCFCGAVQLAFVSLALDSIHLPLLTPAFKPPANPRPRPDQNFPLPLHGLPQDYRIHVRIQLYRRRHTSKAPAWPRKPDLLQPIALHRLRQHHDEPLLFHVRHTHVPRQFESPGAEYSSYWHGG